MADEKRIDPLSEFGRVLMVKLRDRGIDHLDRMLAAKAKAPALQKLQGELESLDQEQRALFRRAFVTSLDSAIHDFLFALQEQHDSGGRVAVLVDGSRIAEASDGLHGELFTEDGWFARYSRHGEPPEEA